MGIANVSAAETKANNIDNPTTFFSAFSTSSISPTFLVNKEPWYIEAFNLDTNDTVTVQQVAGTGSGTFFQNYAPAGAPLQLTRANTKIRVDWPGNYRLVFAGTSVTATHVLGFSGTMTQESSTVYSVSAGATNPIIIDGVDPVSVTGTGVNGDPFEIAVTGLSGVPGTPVSGLGNTLIGDQAGNNASITGGIFIGQGAGVNAVGTNVVAIGTDALQFASSSGVNVTGTIAIGLNTGTDTNVQNATLIGNGAGKDGLANISGTNSIAIGAGSCATDTSVAIGLRASTKTFTNGICIGHDALATADNQAVIGDSSVTQMRTAGSVIAAGAISASDSRLKRNLNPLEDATATLNALPIVEFSWDQSRLDDAGLPYLAVDMNKRHTGVIAQDLEAILPQCVKQVEGTDGELYKFVHYDRLIPYLIRALQEQAARILVLENRS